MPQSDQASESKRPHQEFGNLRQVSDMHRDSWWWRDPRHAPFNAKPHDTVNGDCRFMSYGAGKGLSVRMCEQRQDAKGRFKHRILYMELGPDAKRSLFKHLLEDPDMVELAREVLG